jgi:hypothetical protein
VPDDPDLFAYRLCAAPNMRVRLARPATAVRVGLRKHGTSCCFAGRLLCHSRFLHQIVKTFVVKGLPQEKPVPSVNPVQAAGGPRRPVLRRRKGVTHRAGFFPGSVVGFGPGRVAGKLGPARTVDVFSNPEGKPCGGRNTGADLERAKYSAWFFCPLGMANRPNRVAEFHSGGRGTRTPKRLRAAVFKTAALPIRTIPPTARKLFDGDWFLNHDCGMQTNYGLRTNSGPRTDFGTNRSLSDSAVRSP